MISLDGFRWDYTEMYNTPFLDSMAAEGVSGALVPSFPSKTFPNHYALATGLRPEHHGIIANSFYSPKLGEEFSLSNRETKNNPKFWGGEPLWLTAQRQGLHTAVYHWPGSDVKINGAYPDKYFDYDTHHLTVQQRIDGIVEEANRKNGPQLIMAYFEQPDANGHSYGPQDKRTKAAVERMDSVLRCIYSRIEDKTECNFVVVSDHGMSYVPSNHVIHPDMYLKRSWYKHLDGNLPTNIYAADNACADSIVEALSHVVHLRAWKKTDVPQYLYYNDNDAIGDVVVLPDIGFIFQNKDAAPGGTHGWDPQMMDMHALFRAVGPGFKHAYVGHFDNTAVYPLICHLLGIKPAANDGSLKPLEQALR